jgi:hypothetical protein
MFNSKLSIHCVLWILGAVFLTSCLHQSSSALTGKWQETRGRAIIEFFENRTFKTVDNMGMTVSGTYSINDKGNVRFEIKHEDASAEIIDAKVSIAKDEMILNFGDTGEVEKYRKVEADH